MTQLWCNGQWLAAGDFAVAPTDRGLLSGLGLFETMLALDGEPVFAERHLARLAGSCRRLGWQLELPGLRGIIQELIARNDLGSGPCRIRLAITGGSGPIGDLALGADHRLWITAVAAATLPLTTKVNLAPWVRNEHSPLAGLKCASYAENLLALQDAARRGFAETLFLNTAGHLCEAATANVFLVRHGQLFTPALASGCLPGITRGVVIELAQQQGIPCTECQLTLAELQAADELFLTSAIRGLTGVARFAERAMPPGPVTLRLRQAWAAATRRKIGS